MLSETTPTASVVSKLPVPLPVTSEVSGIEWSPVLVPGSDRTVLAVLTDMAMRNSDVRSVLFPINVSVGIASIFTIVKDAAAS